MKKNLIRTSLFFVSPTFFPLLPWKFPCAKHVVTCLNELGRSIKRSAFDPLLSHFRRSRCQVASYPEVLFIFNVGYLTVPDKMESAAVLSATCPSWREIEPTATYTKFGSVRYRSVTPLLCQSLRRKPDKRDKLAAPYTRRGRYTDHLDFNSCMKIYQF